MKRLALISGLAVLLAEGALWGQSSPPIRVMPLGDSMTLGFSLPTSASGYRKKLYNNLTGAGYNVDFVGTLSDTPTPNLPDLDHEGHGGFKIADVDAGVAGWLSSVKDPDVILLLIGTNDFSPPQDNPDTAKTRLQTLISHLAALRPFAEIVVANLPLRTDNATSNSAIETKYNPYIPGIVDGLASSGLHVSFVDIHSLLTASDLDLDGLHPNQAGYDKIADAWTAAVTSLASPLGTTIAPAIIRATAQVDRRHVMVTFSKPLEDAAASVANFQLSGGATVLQASLDSASKRIVTLTTSVQAPNTSYTLTVNGVRDRTTAHLVIAPGTAVTVLSKAIAEASDYTEVYGIDLPAFANFKAGAVPYAIDAHASVGAFDRVAYYLELQQGTAPDRYIWASMNAFTTDASKLGIPTATSGAFFQKPVANMNVRSNVAGIVTGDGLAGGVLEFWPGDYAATNTAGVPGASDSAFDWGDAGTPGRAGYGSMQIQNSAANQTLLAFNGWGGAGFFGDLGLGNQTGGQPDWTLAENALDYSGRKLEVYVRPAAVPSDPFISGQPSNQAIAAGSPVTFNVTASGTAPLSYQWRFNGTNISGANGSSYTIASVQSARAGNYDVVVSNASGPVTSAPAALTVTNPGTLANGSFESGYAGWMANGNQTITQRSSDGANAVGFNVGNSIPNGTLVQSVPTVAGQTYVLAFDVGVFGTANIEQRLNVTVQGNGPLVYQTISAYGTGGSTPTWVARNCTFVADGKTTSISFQDDSSTTNGVDLLLDNVRLVATAPVTPTVSNGSFESDFSGWNFSGNAGVVTYAAATPTDGSKLVMFHPLLTPANAVVSQSFPTVAGQTYLLEFDFGVHAFNTFQQRLQVTAQGNSTLLTQTATINGVGSGITKWVPTSYVFIADSASTTLTFRDQSPTSQDIIMLLDNVRVTVQAVRTLTVASSPDSGVTITVSPTDRNNAGDGATPFSRQYNHGTIVNLTAPAGSPNGKAFQKWQQDGADLTTNASTSVTMDGNHTLTAVYVAGTGAPVITGDPQNLTAAVGGAATFSVTATGTAPLAFQWRFNNAPISGATASTYTIGSVQAAQAGNYDVVVSNAGGSKTSAAAVLTVIASGLIANGSFESDYTGWTATGNQSVGVGAATDGANAVSFNANDTAPNGVLVQRFATNSGQTYTLAFDAGAYAFNTKEQRLQVTVLGGTALVSDTVSIFGIGGGATTWVAKSYTFVADSSVTTLTFRDVSATTSSLDLKLDNVRVTTPGSPNAPAITSQPASLTAAVGKAVSFSVTATGTSLGYQWRLNGANISGATQSTYTIASVQQANAGNYDVVVSNSSGSVTSSVAALTVITSGILANGSFESDYAGWTPTGNQAIGPRASDGVKAVAFNSAETTPNGVLVQRFATTAGKTYTLTFDAGVYAFNTRQQMLQVTVQGGSTLLSQTVTVTGAGNGTVSWTPKSYSFVADSAATTLTFADISTTTSNLDLLLDNVRIELQGVRTLSIASTPDDGATIIVSPADNNGAANGATPFSRSYNDGTLVNLTAPGTFAGKTFQKWQKDGADFSTSAATSVTLTASSTLTAVYSATVAAPVITKQPANLTASIGSTANFSVTATGTAPLSYQWRFNGGAISGATQSSFAIGNVQPANAGNYDVVVSNAGGPVTSTAAVLTVPASGPLANGSFENDYAGWTATGNQMIGGRASDGAKAVAFNTGETAPNGVLVQRFATTAGQSYTLAFDVGVYSFTAKQQKLQVTVQGGSTLLSQTITVTGAGNGTTSWTPKSYSFVADSATTTLTFTDVSTTTANLDLLLDNVHLDLQGVHTLSIASAPDTGVMVTISPVDNNGASDGDTPIMRSFDEGTVVNVTAPETTADMTFQKWQKDGVDFSDSATTSIEIEDSATLTAVYAADTDVPEITSGPENLTAETGSAATFSVTATGPGTLSYQWRFNGDPIADATESSYTIDEVQSSDAGSYDVVVSNENGSTTSAAAELTVTTSGALANGSFESDYAAWIASGNQMIGTRASDGAKAVTFNSGNTTPDAELAQRFATAIGHMYVLAFDQGVYAFNTSSQKLQLTVQGASTLLSQTLSLSGTGGGAVNWVRRTYSFIADSAITTLTFRDVSPTTANLDQLLDNVTVE